MSEFSVAAPAELRQVDWCNDELFVESLLISWKAQYADYLGAEVASNLVDSLRNSGEILQHDALNTWAAVVGRQIVGVAALRQLPGISLITLLEVLPSFRGLGIARRLIDVLSVNGSPLLAHVSIHRPHVKAFYDSLGFLTLQQNHVDHYGHALLFDVMVRPSQTKR